MDDSPGCWAEFRVYEEGGTLRAHRSISGRDALAWAEKTPGVFGGECPQSSLGELGELGGRRFAVAAHP